MSNLNPKFTSPQSNTTAQAVLTAILALLGVGLTSYDKSKGRVSKLLDQMVDTFWRSQANKANKALEAKAKNDGKPWTRKKDGVTPYDAIRGVYNGDPLFQVAEFDAARLIDRMCSTGEIAGYLSPKDAIKVFNGLTEHYVNHPGAKEFITIDELSDEDVEELDNIPPKIANPVVPKGKSNGEAVHV